MRQVFNYLKKLLVFLIPFFLFFIAYLLYDPFMVLYHYEDYNKKVFIPKNRDFISTEMYINNREKYNYDSFIFGSSAALFVPPSVWQGYLNDYDFIYSFDASRENIIGIWSKIKFIDGMNKSITNALVIIDYDKAFNQLERENVLFTKHYKVLPSSLIDFQYRNFLKIINPSLLRALISYLTSKEFKPFMAEFLIEEDSYIDPVTNEYLCFSIKEELKTDSLKYYELRKEKFPSRTGTFQEIKPQINEEHIRMLMEMKEIFTKNNTCFRLIIAPNYEQISFSGSDLEILNSIFGKESVFDFSGINRYSDQMSNFYDGLHFKTYAWRELLDIAYSRRMGERMP